MECKNLRITAGNDFTLVVDLAEKIEGIDGTSYEHVAESTTDVTIVTSTGKRIAVPRRTNGMTDHDLQWWVDDTEDDKTIAIKVPCDMQVVDKYGLVINGAIGGQHWRYKAKPGEAFEIADATSEQNVNNTSIRVFRIEATVGLAGGAKSAYEIAVEHGFEGDEEAWIASLKGEPGTNFTYQDLTPANKRDLMSYFDLSRIYAFANTQNSIDANFGYNRIDFEVGTLTINLPTPDDVDYLQTLIIYLFTGASPDVNFSSGNITRRFTDSYLISANCRYEISCLFNGLEWIITSILID